jgi:ubiquinone/menaquinone biosynthesis C-methylase UbiE
MRPSAGFSPLLALLGAALLLAGPSGCAAWKRFQYEGFGRDAWQKPDEVVALLGIGAGDRVADVGAGGGYFTFRFADAVGETGRVYAVDVDEDLLAYLDERVRDEGRANVEVVRATFDDPKLPDGEVDLVFVSNTYHHIQERPAYFRRLLLDLAPNGRVAILELDDRSWLPRTMGHFTPAEAVAAEMNEAGYRLEARHEGLERQSFQIFEPDDGTGE